MKIRITFFLISLLVLLSGCVKNEVKLTFELPKDINTPCRILYYASGKNIGVVRETVAEINNGRGEVTLPLANPAIICLFSTSGKTPSAILYAKRGEKFMISGKNGTVGEWSITGNETTESISKWRIENYQLIRNAEETPEKLNKEIENYVKGNRESRAAAIILYYYYVRRGNEREFYKLQSLLAKELLEDGKLMSAISQGDLMTDLPASSHLPKEIVLTNDSGYADTVSLAKGAGTLLLFRASSDNGVHNDSIKILLRKLSKADIPSAKRPRIAELYMEVDSLNWRRYLKRDTLKGMTRMWMPLGFADSVALLGGIRRTPYYIVTGPSGKELYRGNDWIQALKKFETLKP